MAHILIVDDDTVLRSMLKIKLERLGHVVDEAANGLQAWNLFKEKPSDLIIMDLIMPEQEGLETIQKFRKNKIPVRILAISGGGRLDPRDLLQVARQFGADAILAKPFTHEQLTEVLQKLLPTVQEKNE